MSFLAVKEAPVGLAWFDIDHSSTNPTTGTYYTLTQGTVNDLSITGSGTTTLTFPPGIYYLKANVGGNRAARAAYIDYQWEVDGTLVGNQAGWDKTYHYTVEYTEAVIRLSAPTNVRLYVPDHSNTFYPSYSNTVLPDYSGAYIMGHSL